MTVIFKSTWNRGKQLPFPYFSPFPYILIFTVTTMYPTPQEQAVINEAEKIMIETMARYDPSHDQYHGERNLTSAIEKCTDQLEFRDWTRFYSVQRVRKTALTLAKTISPTPDLLTVELGLHFFAHRVADVLTCPSSCLASWYFGQEIRYRRSGCGPLCLFSTLFRLNGSFTWSWSCRRWTRSNHC